MKTKIKKNIDLLLALLSIYTVVPLVARSKTFKEVVDIATGGLAKAVVDFLFVLASVMFFWGIAQYSLNPYQDAKDKGKKYALWGLLGLVVMFSVYSLINILQDTFF